MHVIFVFLASYSSLVAAQQMVIEYDTSAVTDGFKLECDPTNTLGACKVDKDSYSRTIFFLHSYDIKNKLFTPPAEEFQHFFAAGCNETNKNQCTVACDDQCTCVTGTFNESFSPDGGTCPVISTTIGSIPPAPTSAAPSMATPVDEYGAIVFDGTNADASHQMRITCPGVPLHDNYCKVYPGTIFVKHFFVDDNTRGFTGCQLDGVCLLECSGACSCEFGTFSNSSVFEATGGCATATLRPSQTPSASGAPSSSPFLPTSFEPTIVPSSSTTSSSLTMKLFVTLFVGGLISVGAFYY